jgi:NAD(P)-dependent dehydrogenase (short-subunit alcohol dehydrogenase family)
LAGRRVLVVGGGQQDHGIDDPPIGNGRAMAILFAREGAGVAVADIDAASAEATGELVRAEGAEGAVIVGDAAEEGDVVRMFEEARVALAGPLLGSLAAVPFWLAGLALDSSFLRAVAFTGFFLNLFNLIPVVPLDGGRAVAALSPRLWAVGLVLLVAVVLVWHNPIGLFILLIGGMELWRRWRERKDPERAAYYRVLPWQRAAVAVAYVGLAAALVLGMSATHVPRTF